MSTAETMTWPAENPAEVRAHLALLTACGATARTIAAAAGVPQAAVRVYLTRPKVSISAAHAGRVLVLDPVQLGLPRIPAGGTMWRLRSLVALGHPPVRIAFALGTGSRTVRQILAGDAQAVPSAIAQDTRALWEAWWCLLPPTRTAAECQAFTAARQLARDGGWPCPAALDEDELDMPGYRPLGGWRTALGSGTAEDPDPLGKLRREAG